MSVNTHVGSTGVELARGEARELAHAQERLNLIDGAVSEYPVEDCFAVVDPVTGETVGLSPESSADTVDAAVRAAERAFVRWSNVPPLERSRILLRAADRLELETEGIARLIALETGRPVRTEARPEVINAVKIFRYFAGLALESKGDAFAYMPDVLAVTMREPYGVVGAITPWNVPAMLFCLKVAPALVTGNTVVVKPAEQAPLSSMLLARTLAQELPPGVLNVVNGHGEGAGQNLVVHPAVLKLTFTGSVETGRLIYQQGAAKLAPVTLELGGKSPIVIFPDVDVEDAAQQTILGMRFSRQGQSCTSTTRILVHQDVREAYLAALVEGTKKLVVGDPLDEATDIGTVVGVEQADRVRRYVDEAIAEGVESVELNEADAGSRCYLPATLLLDPPLGSRAVQEEIFGPVATVHSWSSFEQVVELANATQYGLSACILTDSSSDALSLARRLQAGFVQINSGMVIQPGISFGGYKASGVGREASLDSMLEAFTQVKTIIVGHSRGTGERR